MLEAALKTATESALWIYPYGRQYRRDIWGFLWIKQPTFGRSGPENPFVARCVASAVRAEGGALPGLTKYNGFLAHTVRGF
jgi:hypothetical protein